MGVNLSTTIVSPTVVAAGGVVAGTVTITPPAAGNFYLLMEQYTVALAAIPGSRQYLRQAAAGGAYDNSTSLVSEFRPVSAIPLAAVTVSLTVPNTDCLLYIFLMRSPATITAGAFVVGTVYEIITVGTTDFTLIGAAANAVGTHFAATGVGAGTGTAAEIPDQATDTEVDYVTITLQATATPATTGIDITELMNLMITMMIVMMMMKMMAGMMTKS